MASPEDDWTSILFRGVRLSLPANLPFTYSADGTLVIHCCNFTGAVTLQYGKAVASQEADKTQGGSSDQAQPHQVVDKQPGVQEKQRQPPVQEEVIIPDSQAAPSLGGISWLRSPVKSFSTRRMDGKVEGGVVALPPGEGSHEEGADEAESPNDGQDQEQPPASRDFSPVQPDAQAPPPEAEEQTCKGEAKADATVEDANLTDKPSNSGEAQAGQEERPSGEQATEKENTPAAANRAGKAKNKRKSDKGQPSTGKRSGKKQKGTTPGPSARDLGFLWRPLACKGADGEPPERWGGSFTPLEDGKVCLFAGNSHDEQLGDTWVLDVAELVWERVAVADVPGKAWHSAEYVSSEEGKHLYAIGGERVSEEDDQDEGGECLPEICQLDLEAQIWVTLPISGEKLERSGHSTTLLTDGRILLFGGIDNDQRYRNDAHIIDPHRLHCFSLTGTIVRGAPPKPRAYHTATLVGNSVIVLGGTGTRPWSLKEVYSLSVETWQWKEHTAAVEGEAPSPRSGHTAVALPGERYLVVFGGGIPENNCFFSTVAVLDTWTWTWAVPALQGTERPCGRSGHGMAVVHLPDGRAALAMFGGRTQDEALCKDTWLLDIKQ